MTQKIILVPLDGSVESEAALPYAEGIAGAEQASIRLVTVVDNQFAYLFTASDRPVLDWNERQRERAGQYLEGKAQALRQRGLTVSKVVAEGDPSDAILREADQCDAGMVVTATHGRGGLQRWALGSVADKVMRLGHRPTLLVRPLANHEVAAAVTLRRLAVPLDGSARAEAAIAPAVELAQVAGAQLLLARAEEWLSVSMAHWGGDGAYVPNLAELEQETTEMVQDYLGVVRNRIPSSLRCEAVTLRGLPIQELEALFEQRQVDLVVMTTHGRGGLSRLVLGSTADRLVRDGLPTLLIPSVAGDETPNTADSTTAGQVR